MDQVHLVLHLSIKIKSKKWQNVVIIYECHKCLNIETILKTGTLVENNEAVYAEKFCMPSLSLFVFQINSAQIKLNFTYC